MGGLTEADITSGTVSSSLITDLQDLIDELTSDDAAPWGIVSRFHNREPREAGVIHAITAGTVKTHLGTQRRRNVFS